VRPIPIIRNAISLFLASSLLLTACDVEFAPDIEPLILEEAPDQPFTGEFGPQESSPEELEQEPAIDAEPVNEFTPTDALAQCGSGLSWGDETMGMCLAPGGDSYFAWTEEGNVIRILADASDINQAIFQQAARDRNSAIEEVKGQSRSVIFEGIALGLSVAALIPACATIFWCAIDIAAISVSAGMLADSGDSIVNGLESGESARRRGEYAYCRMTGGSDPQCRASAGIISELGGN